MSKPSLKKPTSLVVSVFIGHYLEIPVSSLVSLIERIFVTQLEVRTGWVNIPSESYSFMACKIDTSQKQPLPVFYLYSKLLKLFKGACLF